MSIAGRWVQTALANTAYSVNIRSGMDFSCCPVLDARVIWSLNAPHVPGASWVSMADSVAKRTVLQD